MTESLLALALLAAFLVWLLRRGRHAECPRSGRADAEIDLVELEAAEREVRELDAGVRPDDGFEGDDWGPGAPRTGPR